jgi:integral membrane protein
MNNPVSLLRKVTLAEATSFLVLLFIAMPLKYAWGMPMAVRIAGSIHGALFIAFCFALMRVMNNTTWPFKRAALVFAVSFLPFVPFFFDRRLKAWEAEQTAE